MVFTAHKIDGTINALFQELSLYQSKHNLELWLVHYIVSHNWKLCGNQIRKSLSPIIWKHWHTHCRSTNVCDITHVDKFIHLYVPFWSLAGWRMVLQTRSSIPLPPWLFCLIYARLLYCGVHDICSVAWRWRCSVTSHLGSSCDAFSGTGDTHSPRTCWGRNCLFRQLKRAVEVLAAMRPAPFELSAFAFVIDRRHSLSRWENSFGKPFLSLHLFR